MQAKCVQEEHDQKIQDMKDKFAFRIEALENALSETKMKSRRDYERISMHAQEMESRLMNTVKEEKHSDSLLQELEEDTAGIRSVKEARQIIE